MNSKIKGMPDRTGININKPEIEDDNLDFNPYLSDYDELNLDDELPGDDTNNAPANFRAPSSLTDIKGYQIELLKFNDFFYRYLFKVENNFFVNSTGLYMVFQILFCASSRNSTIILRDFFNFSTIEESIKDLNKLDNLCSSVNHNTANMIIVGDDIKLNKSFINNFDSFLELFIIKNNGKRIQKIANDIGKNINKDIKVENLVILNMSKTIPKWKYLCKDLILGKFNGKKHYFIKKTNESIGYYNDNEFKIIEIELQDDWLLGFLTSKNRSAPDINITEIRDYWKLIDKVHAGEIYIPLIRFENKLKFNGMFKEGKIKNIFNGLDIPKLTNSFLPVDKILHNSSFYMKTPKRTGNSSSTKGTGKYSINRTTMVYIRKKNNWLTVMSGLYSG